MEIFQSIFDSSNYQVYLFAFVGIVGYIVWRLFFKSYNLSKDYTSFGYEFSTGSNGRSNSRKKEMINWTLKRRKIGDLPPPYPNSWYSILDSEDLPPGNVKEVFVLGQSLVAWRGRDSNQVYVSDAYCPHLGAHLAVGGTVVEDCIQCPFHKWTFDGRTGNVDNIPYAIDQAKLQKAKLRGLRLWRVVEVNGFVYVWFHEDGDEPKWFPEGNDNASLGKLTFHGRSEFLVTCHIQEIPENGADVAHLNALHDAPAFFSGKLGRVINGFTGKFLKHIWTADWNVNEEPTRGHESVINLSHDILLFGNMLEFFHVNVVIRQIGAGIVAMHFSTALGDGILFQNVTPVEPMLQRVTHRFYSRSRIFHPVALLILQSEAVQISRDIEIWNRKCYLQKPTLIHEDGKIMSFRRWFSQFYSNARRMQKEGHLSSSLEEI